ncbi:hypothetical protein LIA77_08120 [Sarocladium implicatum]|nr:hypothetical protein LIA77_08120 [Sarocladium implicatum]
MKKPLCLFLNLETACAAAPTYLYPPSCSLSTVAASDIATHDHLRSRRVLKRVSSVS